jgi:hypothetical protein
MPTYAGTFLMRACGRLLATRTAVGPYSLVKGGARPADAAPPPMLAYEPAAVRAWLVDPLVCPDWQSPEELPTRRHAEDSAQRY